MAARSRLWPKVIKLKPKGYRSVNMNYYKFPEDINNAPNSEGVYFLSKSASDDGIIYVGRADNLRERLLQHPDPENSCLEGKDISYFAYEVTNNSREREEELIKGHDPECNCT